ncbi:MAG: flippase-like domain-containing protein [Ktedonobacteraceae bacterium]|nr:flippase-like domain-containing protein [Ktedonobacteraceae bacterium]MBO0790272.1 flippase-like domain-containing protein [Ktedonobacteraceae bacterium]
MSTLPTPVPEAKQQERAKPERRWLKLGLRAAVTALIFAILLRSVSWPMLISTLIQAQRAWLMMGLAIGVLCVVFSSYVWYSLVRAEGIRGDLARLINLYLVGMAFSHLLPSSVGGDVAKAYYVGRESGNVAGAASSVMLSRVTGFLGMLLIALPSLVIWHSYFTPGIVLGFLGSSLLLLLLVGGALLWAGHLPTLARRILPEKWAAHRLVTTIQEIGQALNKTARQPRVLCQAIGFALLFWLASFLNYYGYAAAIGIHVPLHCYVIAISFTALVAFLPISINGFGIREGALVFVFSTMHVPRELSLLLAFLMDIQVLFFGLIGTCIYLFSRAARKG